MIAEIGHFALILAFGVALFQMIVPMIGAAKGWTPWMESATRSGGPIRINRDCLCRPDGGFCDI